MNPVSPTCGRVLVGLFLAGLFQLACVHEHAWGQPYSEWAADSLPGDVEFESRLPTGDPDRDGLENAIEWFCGCDPMQSDDERPYWISESGGAVFFWFKRSLEVDFSVSEIQVSGDLSRWEEITDVLISGELVDGRMHHRVPVDLSSGSLGFVRLAVFDLGGPVASVGFDFSDAVGATVAEARSGNGGLSGELRGGAEFVSGFGGENVLRLEAGAHVAVPLGPELELDAGTGYSVATWLRLDEGARLADQEDRFVIAGKGIWTRPPFFSFGLRGGEFRGMYFQVHDGGLAAESSAFPLAIPSVDVRSAFEDGGWHHVAFTRDQSGMGRLYLDGAEVGHQRGMGHPVDHPGAELLARGEMDSPLDELWIGRGYLLNDDAMPGNLAGFEIYHEALDSIEVANLVSSGSPTAEWEPWRQPMVARAEIFVSPEGDDGGDGSEVSPFATIGRALEAVHAPGESRRHVFVKHGIYREGLQRFFFGTRRPNEMVITVPGVTLEAEPRGELPGEVVSVRGSLSKSAPVSSPLHGRFPEWEPVGGGLYRSAGEGTLYNLQSFYFEGEPLDAYGDTTMYGSLGQLLQGTQALFGHDPHRLPENSFWNTEPLKICVPASGGAAIGDGQQFWCTSGLTKIVFEFSEIDDGRVAANTIPIIYSNGKDVFGDSDEDAPATSQADLAAAIQVALMSAEASALALTPTLDDEFQISLGDREVGDGSWRTLSTRLAPSLSCREWEYFIKLPGGADPNDESSDLEIPFCTHLLSIEADDVRVKGFEFRHTNTTAITQGAAIEVGGDRAWIEDNDIVDCDFVGLNLRAEFGGGLANAREGVVLLKNRINRCGNSGIGSTFSRDCRFVGNVTNHNNRRRFNQAWHAGGIKLNNNHENLKLIQHTARGNVGTGIWFDTVDPRHRPGRSDAVIADAYSVLISECTLEFNHREGCFFEKSRNGTITDNVVRYNRREGIRISKSSNCIVARNFISGNSREGIVKDTSIKLLTATFFSVPVTHPLADNWTNTQIYSLFPFIGNRFMNNILRNNSVASLEEHDTGEADRAVAAGWGTLPINLGTAPPTLTLPGDNGTPDETFSSVGLRYIQSNSSDHNLLWKGGGVVLYGYGPSPGFAMGNLTPERAGPEKFFDNKDFDVGSDGKADRRIPGSPTLYENGATTHYEAFPNPGVFGFDSNTQVLDSFEFLDNPEGLASLGNPVPGVAELLDPDGDGDGLVDWWEGSYGLDPDSAEGQDGASGDPDGDGRSNLEEFEIWKLGKLPSGERFSSLAEFREWTWPTYRGPQALGRARDLDGDLLPDLWERYYGLDPSDSSDGATHRRAFLTGKEPGALAEDLDGDLLPDFWEMSYFGDLDESGEGDTDGDGYSNRLEFRLWTLPNDAADPIDRDSDGLADHWETPFGILPTSAVGENGGDGDIDGDGYSNRAEFEAFTHPLRASSHPEG